MSTNSKNCFTLTPRVLAVLLANTSKDAKIYNPITSNIFIARKGDKIFYIASNGHTLSLLRQDISKMSEDISGDVLPPDGTIYAFYAAGFDKNTFKPSKSRKGSSAHADSLLILNIDANTLSDGAKQVALIPRHGMHNSATTVKDVYARIVKVISSPVSALFNAINDKDDPRTIHGESIPNLSPMYLAALDDALSLLAHGQSIKNYGLGGSRMVSLSTLSDSTGKPAIAAYKITDVYECAGFDTFLHIIMPIRMGIDHDEHVRKSVTLANEIASQL